MQQQGSRLTLNGAKVEREKLLRLMLLPFNNTQSSHCIRLKCIYTFFNNFEKI